MINLSMLMLKFHDYEIQVLETKYRFFEHEWLSIISKLELEKLIKGIYWKKYIALMFKRTYKMLLRYQIIINIFVNYYWDIIKILLKY